MSRFKLIKGGAVEPAPDEALSALKARVSNLEAGTDAAVPLNFRIIYVGGERQVPIALMQDDLVDALNIWGNTISVPEAKAAALAFLLYLANRRMR